MRKAIKAATSKEREFYESQIEDMRINSDMREQIDDILLEYGASEDDSDREEGLYVTMSNLALKQAYLEIMKISDERVTTEREFTAAEGLLIDNGFKSNYIDSSYGSVEYFIKGTVGVVLCSPEEAKSLAKKLL